jgi:hypothetical protein
MIITAAQWQEVLAGVDAYAALTVVLPVPIMDPAAYEVGRLLRDAARLIGNGEPAKAVIDARRAIEKMDAVLGAGDTRKSTIKAIADIDAEQRTEAQRLALLRHALFSLASPPAHADERAATFTWNRETALAVVAAVAALAAVRASKSSSEQ